MPEIICDGCGQPASSEHTARRLQRLEWATRYRPIHLHTLLLGAISPADDANFLYWPGEARDGEAADILAAAGLETGHKSAEAIHAEFQRRGLFLAHILECPLEGADGNHSNQLSDSEQALLLSRLPTLFTRIRRSLKPKRIALVTASLDFIILHFADTQLGCELLLDDGHAFALDSSDPARAKRSLAALQQVLAVPATR
jgi:hypothetical protein